MKNSKAEEILSAIKSASRILINMDTRTDIDAICSVLLVKWWLAKLGKKANAIHANEIKESMGRYFDCSDIKQMTDIADIDLSKYDLVVFADSGDFHHLSLQENYSFPKHLISINIDHHQSNNYFGTLNYVVPLGSCCSVIYKLFRELKVKLDDYSRNLIARGIITDSGFFSYDSAKAEDFRMIGDLTDGGVKVYEIMNEMKNIESVDQIKYKQLVYENMVVDHEKRYAYSTLNLKELSNRGIDHYSKRTGDIVRNRKEVDSKLA